MAHQERIEMVPVGGVELRVSVRAATAGSRAPLLLCHGIGALWLHRLHQDTLVLTGESDRIVPVANGKILAGRIPNARLDLVPGGHLFLLTQPNEMAARVNAFLDAP